MIFQYISKSSEWYYMKSRPNWDGGQKTLMHGTNVETINERQKCSPEMDISSLDKS